MAALRSYAIVDSAPDPAYDAFSTLVARACATPIAFVSFVDASRQWFKSSVGLDIRETDRDIAFCGYAIERDDLVEIPDTLEDERFANNPLVTGPPRFRFYAGMPLLDRAGNALGTLCAMDVRPRSLEPAQRDALRTLAASLVALVESRRERSPRELASDAMLNGAIEHIAEAVAILDYRATAEYPTIGYVNRAFADMFGYAPAELIGKRPAILFGAATDATKMARIAADARAGNYGTETVYLYTAAGAARLIELRDRPIDAMRHIVSARDLTRIAATQEALRVTNLRLQSLLANNSDAVITIDASGACIDANAAAVASLGYERTELQGFGFMVLGERGLFHDDALFPEDLAAGRTIRFSGSYRDRDGRLIEMDSKAVPIVVQGRTDGAYVIGHDVTERRRLEARLAARAQRTRALYLISAQKAAGAGSGDQIDAAIALVLEAFDMQFGYVGESDRDSFHIRNAVGEPVLAAGETLELDRTHVRETLAFGDVLAVDDLERAATARTGVPSYPGWHGYISAPLVVDGRTFGALGFLSRRVVAFDEDDRDFVRLVSALVSSALERAAHRARLDRLAFFDSLTGLPNRARFMSELDGALSLARAGERAFALHFVDLDGFKDVNDRFGHATGDLALVEAARRIAAVSRDPDDRPARLGGDEFVVIQNIADPTRAPASARAFGERVVAALARPYVLDGKLVSLGASSGVAIFPHDGSDATALLSAADLALYRAKAAGKNRVEIGARESVGDELDPIPEGIGHVRVRFALEG